MKVKKAVSEGGPTITQCFDCAAQALETMLFVTVLFAIVKKTDLQAERVSEEAYNVILTVLFLPGLVVLCIVITISTCIR